MLVQLVLKLWRDCCLRSFCAGRLLLLLFFMGMDEKQLAQAQRKPNAFRSMFILFVLSLVYQIYNRCIPSLLNLFNLDGDENDFPHTLSDYFPRDIGSQCIWKSLLLTVNSFEGGHE